MSKTDLSKVGSNVQNELTLTADSKEIKTLGLGGTNVQAVNGFTYRQDWGNRRGQWKLTLNSSAISNQSKVLVSICEWDGVSGQGFVGAARYTVHNVAPFNGGVTVWINIEWSADIRIRMDYLVVN